VKVKNVLILTEEANKALVRTQTTLRFVCAAQLSRYAVRALSFTLTLTVAPPEPKLGTYDTYVNEFLKLYKGDN